MAKGLTPKREKFCQEMAKLGNQYKAYCKAYNTKNMKRATIDNNAYMLMQDSEIQARLKELGAEIKNKNIADAQEIQETLTKLMRGEIQEECVTVEGTGDGCSEARIITKQVTPKDRIKAGETLAKMRGYFDLTIKIENTPIIKDDV